MLPEIERLDIDLAEIQDIDARVIVKHKLEQALGYKEGQFIVEDTALYMEALNHVLPGPLIKWFMKAVGPEGLYDIAKGAGKYGAQGRAIFGYARSPQDIHFFEGSIAGKIVPPTSDSGFGWDPVFRPDGFDKSFAEMSLEEKNAISHRGLAIKKLKDFLESGV